MRPVRVVPHVGTWIEIWRRLQHGVSPPVVPHVARGLKYQPEPEGEGGLSCLT